jgi:hypothetical protein
MTELKLIQGTRPAVDPAREAFILIVQLKNGWWGVDLPGALEWDGHPWLHPLDPHWRKWATRWFPRPQAIVAVPAGPVANAGSIAARIRVPAAIAIAMEFIPEFVGGARSRSGNNLRVLHEAFRTCVPISACARLSDTRRRRGGFKTAAPAQILGGIAARPKAPPHHSLQSRSRLNPPLGNGNARLCARNLEGRQ